MLEKGFLRNQPDDRRNHHQVASILSRTLLYLGMLILIVSFVYLLANIDQSDKLIGLMMPFLVAGLGLIGVSLFIRRAYNKLRR